jgi:hypothetical protein
VTALVINLILGGLNLFGKSKLSAFVAGWCLAITLILFLFHIGIYPSKDVMEFMGIDIGVIK